MRRKYIITGVVALILLVTGALILFWTDKSNAPAPTTSIYSEGQEVSLNGEMVCLSHADTDGPQTLECAIGFKDTNSTFYALKDTTSDYSIVSSAPMGEAVNIIGIYRKNTDTKYQQNGLIEVTKLQTVQP